MVHNIKQIIYFDLIKWLVYGLATQEIGTVMPYIDLGMTEGVSTQFVSEFGVSPPTFIKFPIGYGTESAVGVSVNYLATIVELVECLALWASGSDPEVLFQPALL